MFKNTASQKLTVLAFADAGHATLDAGDRVTGDAANITLKIEQDDDGTQSASNDVNPTEVEDGQYRFDLTQAETNGDKLTFYPESSTAGVQVVALPSMVIYTRPPNFPALGIETDGDLTKVNTLNGHTAQTGDSFARLGAPAGASVSADIATVDSNVDAILVDTAEIGAAGAGLTAVPWNAAWDAEVQSEVADALAVFWTSPATLVDLVWDEVLTGGTHNVTNSAGKRLRAIDAAFEVHSGTAQGGTATTITLDAGASASDDIYRGDRIVIVGGTGAQEHGIITSYDGTTKVATMSEAWVVTPDNTSEFEIVPADVDVETWRHVAVTTSSTTQKPEVDMVSVSDDSTAAANLELFFDGTGYAASNSTVGTVTTVTNGVSLAAGAITNASLAGNMEIVFETDFATNYNATRNAWVTNAQDFVGTTASDPFNGQVVAASVTANVGVSSLTSAAITDVWATDTLVEAYPADGAAGTPAELLYLALQCVSEFAIVGTTLTVKKLDGTTTAGTWTLDDSANPTSRTRAT